ncbi:cell wall-binding repeat-containing protein [Candidatus Clostridium radicumherbarum]|uniref:Cell wall-binding repeat-containing protein n=1 Tax=Candidatus Clostridium radicumherbarum TaxID=3381662 RepID=A0ABW8TVY2_9CLOT
MVKRKIILAVMALCIAAQLVPYKAFAAPIAARLSGTDRYETAIKVSQDSWQSSDYVVIASGEDFPDALCAAPLAKKYDAPILLTQNAAIPTNVVAEIQRLGAKNVFIVGGTGVISSAAESVLNGLNIQCTRIQGQDRYETSAKVAQIIGTSNGVAIASGENFPDALSIAPIAAAKQMPILLTNSNTIASNIKNLALNSSGEKYVIGGSGVISDTVAASLGSYKRLAGVNRYETNLAVIKEFSSAINFNKVYISTGNDFADALTGSAAAALTSSSLVLTDGTDYNTNNFIKSEYYNISSLKVLGGTAVVSDLIVNALLREPSSKVILGYATYYYPGDSSSYNSITAHSDIINQIATDTYNTDGTGNLTGLLPVDQINYANSKNIDAYAMVANDFDGSIAKTLLESSANRANLINNISNAIRVNNFKGVNIDLEGIYSSDRVYLTTFMRELYSALHPQGYKVTIAVPAKTIESLTDGWAGAYDYAELANNSDEVVIMTYDEHYAGGAPGPIASEGWVQSVVNYAVNNIPSEKILLGIAAYGYDWPSNGAPAKAYGVDSMYNLAASYGAQINWDPVSDTNYFNYTDSSSVYHSVWFENSTSIAYKLDIVNNNNLGGIAIWRLGLENADYWTSIKTKLN